MDHLVGIDLGSTSLKVVVFDPDGRVVSAANRSTELLHPYPDHPQWATWDPQQIWSGVADACCEAIAHLDDAKNIRAVAVTGMGMDGVPVDKDGRWLYPFISWHCPRTVPQQQWWLEHIGAEKQFSITGNPIWPINTALRILWMRENEPAILEKTDKWLLIEDFLNFQLCGERATDYSMASNTLLFDQRTRTYSEELLKLSGIDRRLLCEPRPSGTLLGKVHQAAADVTGLPVGTPVVLGGHDFLCGCLPVGAFQPGVVLDVTGTWEIIVTSSKTPPLTETARQMGWWIDSHVARDMYAPMGSAVAGDMLEWFRRVFGFEEAQRAVREGGTDWDYLMTAAAAAPPGADGVMFLPHMSGSTIPVIDPQSRGAFIGLRNTATKGHLLRAVVEGLNYQFLQILAGLDKGLGLPCDKLVVVGGGTRNEFWMQNRADMLGQPFEVPAVEEATPLGAAILAGIGVGIYRDEQDAFERVYRPGRIYEPNRALTAEYAERFKLFEQLYPSLRSLHAALFRNSRDAKHE